jgi:hypothetical protein
VEIGWDADACFALLCLGLRVDFEEGRVVRRDGMRVACLYCGEVLFLSRLSLLRVTNGRVTRCFLWHADRFQVSVVVIVFYELSVKVSKGRRQYRGCMKTEFTTRG